MKTRLNIIDFLGELIMKLINDCFIKKNLAKIDLYDDDKCRGVKDIQE